jgi:hypothetical protein
MGADQIEAIRALLDETEAAHGAYETTELNGVYDMEWPAWYAAYAVEHGIDDLIGRQVPADELGRFFSSAYAEFQQADPKPSEPWAAYTARRLGTGMS